MQLYKRNKYDCKTVQYGEYIQHLSYLQLTGGEAYERAQLLVRGGPTVYHLFVRYVLGGILVHYLYTSKQYTKHLNEYNLTRWKVYKTLYLVFI